ncbi:phasin family protein [Sphingomonas sp.]|uniref:phasin family protein n=1 Tax=Sphingomonas sp. TaxID=28214 RepID=UPI001B0A7D19|nr:TIGR01841 family phasin [Sphingomonas sp.]MBO9713417.1 TIGR01841 family phasin [Sphingomonas sp.]
MASKGPKDAGKSNAPKPKAGSRPAPKAKVAAAAAEKPAPVVEAEIVIPPASEPVPAAEAAPQEVETPSVIEVAEAAEPVVAETVETVDAQAEETVEAVEAAAEPIAVEPIVETVEEIVVEPVVAAGAVAIEAVKESKVMETIETNMAKAQAFFTEFNDRAKAAVEKSTKLVEEANEFAKGNLEAFVESGKITAKGLESFGQDAAEYSRKSFESATAALKNLAAVKSPTEFFKLQSDYFRTSFDSAVAEASKNTEALIKLAGDAAQPLSNRVAVAAEKAKIAA